MKKLLLATTALAAFTFVPAIAQADPSSWSSDHRFIGYNDDIEGGGFIQMLIWISPGHKPWIMA